MSRKISSGKLSRKRDPVALGLPAPDAGAPQGRNNNFGPEVGQNGLIVYDNPLDIFNSLAHVVVRQRVNIVELVVGADMNNSYEIRDIYGRYIMNAIEHSSWCCRWFCGSSRAFHLSIFDINFRKVVEIHRSLRCCTNKIEVFGPNGQLLGTVQQRFGLCSTRFTVCDNNNNKLCTITGPRCFVLCCSDVNFFVYSNEGQQIGLIAKVFDFGSIVGVARELFTSADTFGISFDVTLNSSTKALLLSTTFLIDFMFFENKDPDNSLAGRMNEER